MSTGGQLVFKWLRELFFYKENCTNQRSTVKKAEDSGAYKGADGEKQWAC